MAFVQRSNRRSCTTHSKNLRGQQTWMSTKCGKTVETTAAERTNRRRMYFTIWQFVLTFDYLLLSMHLVYHQFGVLWHYPEHELIRWQRIFELGKYFHIFFIHYFALALSVSKSHSFPVYIRIVQIKEREKRNCQCLRMYMKERNLMRTFVERHFDIFIYAVGQSSGVVVSTLCCCE